MHAQEVGKGNYFLKGGALFHGEKIADEWLEQLMLPLYHSHKENK